MFAEGDIVRLTRSGARAWAFSLHTDRRLGLSRRAPGSTTAADFVGRVVEVFPASVIVEDILGAVFNFSPSDLREDLA